MRHHAKTVQPSRSRIAKGLDELDRLVVIVEDELTSRDAAVHVVDRSREEKAGVSWHEIAPMRGRDNPILLSVLLEINKCGSVYVAPIGTHAA